MATTSVFLPGESHGQRSLTGYSPWGHKESDMTEQLTFLGAPSAGSGRSYLLTASLHVPEMRVCAQRQP